MSCTNIELWRYWGVGLIDGLSWFGAGVMAGFEWMRKDKSQLRPASCYIRMIYERCLDEM